MKTLTLQQVITFHKKITSATGGSDGVKDIGLVESALNRYSASYDGIEFYPSIIEKISAITHSLISNHGFVDGNKRIGVSVMLMLLKLNDISVEYSQIELIELGLSVASGQMKEIDIREWIELHII